MEINNDALCILIEKINTCKTLAEILNLMAEFFTESGAIHFNYTNLTQNQISKTKFLRHHNYTKEWVENYTLKGYAEIDPAVIYGKIYQKTADWNHSCNVITNHFVLNKKQMELLKSMIFDVAKYNLSNGIGVPITTRMFHQNGFYIVYPNGLNIPKKTILEAVCYIFNNAFTTIADEIQTYENIKFPFSPQERELIKLFYNGKERQDIAEIMQLSINTIDTMTKRIFIKMRVNSKMQLITKIISKGWLGMLN